MARTFVNLPNIAISMRSSEKPRKYTADARRISNKCLSDRARYRSRSPRDDSINFHRSNLARNVLVFTTLWRAHRASPP